MMRPSGFTRCLQTFLERLHSSRTSKHGLRAVTIYQQGPVKRIDDATQPEGEGTPTEQGNAAEEGGYQRGENMAFCPQKELNLPSSYDEVLARFQRLQAGRAMESLN